MTQKVLGINPCIAGLGLHDPSAALFEDGEVVYAAEEERFTRNKHAYDTFPDQAIEACLTHGGIELHELDSIAVPWEPDEYKEVLGYNLKNAIRSVRDRRFDEARQTNLKQNIKHILGYSKAELRDEIEDHATGEGATPPIKTIPHHRSHALSSFLLSRFEEALVVTIDGRGEYESTVAWLAQDGELRKLTSFEFPNSLGFFMR